MTQIAHRRRFLQAALGSAAAATLTQVVPSVALARQSRTPLTATKLSDQLTMISGAGANVVAMGGPEGALLVDGGLQERSAELVKFALKETGAKKVHTLFNTHWHPEQTGSNERLGKAGARIIAHENTKLWLTYPQPVPLRETTWGPLSAKGLPNTTTFDKGSIELGGEQIEYGYLLQAHTDGDLYVYFKQANVIAAGGVVSSEGWPVIDYKTGGWITGLVDGLRKLGTVGDENTRIVPANGPVITKKELDEQRAMFQTIAQRLNGLLRKGMGPDEVLAAAPTKEFDAKYGEPTQFVNLAFRSLWGHAAPDA